MAFGTDYTPVGPMPTDIVLGDVDATSMRLARDIRDKGHGIDTRETMARMILKSSTMHNHLIKVNNALKVQNDEYYRQFTDAINEFSDLKPKAELSISRSAVALTKSQNALNVANGVDAKATNALDLSESANALSKSVQDQFNQVIIDGDSSVEAAQARVGADGQTNPTLKARLDKEHNEVATQLAQTRNLKSWELNSKDREERGIVVFISDDARQEDWNNLRPIFNEEYAPLCLAAIAGKVGTGQYLTKEQLLQLESEGHEIMSHSLDHSGENRIPLASDQEAERQYKESKEVLRGMGLNVNNYAVPYGDYRQRERLLSKKHFRASRTSDYGNQSGLNLSPIATHELNTLWLDETWGKTNFEYFKTHIDLAVEKNALLIISTHGQQVSQTSTQNVFRQVIQYAQQNSEVMTLNDALDIMGNVIEIGDYSYSIDNRSAKQGGHYVVGANGAVSQLNRSGKLNLATPFAEFPFGDNSYILTYGELGDESPTGGGGTLRNVKTHINPHSPLQAFNYQTFKGYGSGEVYIRHLQSSFEFTEWKLFSAKPNYAVYTYTSSYTLEPNEIKTLTVEAHTFPQNTPISVNPQYGAGDNVLFSHYVDGAGKLRIVLFNPGDTTIYITDKKWNIMMVRL